MLLCACCEKTSEIFFVMSQTTVEPARHMHEALPPSHFPQTQRIILQILPQWKSYACGNAEHVPCIYVRKIFCCIFATSSSLFSEPHKNPLCFIYATSTKSVTHQFFTTTGHSSFMILCDVFATLPSMRYLTFDPGLMLPEIGYVTLDLRWRIS